jgi:hypothetical protein
VLAESAAVSLDGLRLAVVSRGARLELGQLADGVVTPVDVTGATLTRPTWAPGSDEVWTVADGRRVLRVRLQPDGTRAVGDVDAEDLTALGPVTVMRLSRDGVRVLAVANDRLYVGAVARGLDGSVAITEVRQLRAQALGQVVAADWRTADSIVAITRNPDRLIAQVGVDGLALGDLPSTNLTPPLTALAVNAERPLLVTDQTGVWTFEQGLQDAWRQQVPGAGGAVPSYPG